MNEKRQQLQQQLQQKTSSGAALGGFLRFFLLMLPARAAAKKTLVCSTKPVSGLEIKSYMCCQDLIILLDFDCYIRGQRSFQYSIPGFQFSTVIQSL